MHKDILADGGKNLLTDRLKQNCLAIGAYHGDDKNARIDCNANEDVAHYEAIGLHKLDNITHNEGGYDIVANGEQHYDAYEKEALPMRLHVNKHTLDDFGILHMAVKADGFLFILHSNVGDDEGGGKEANDASHNQDGIVII
jgi:hypothetical protein